MVSHLCPGLTVEVGSGPGRFAEFYGGVIPSDVLFVPWVDVVLDAMHLPFKTRAVHNLVMLDVFHHLDPSAFLDEATRVLSPGGRVVMIEPYISPFSYLVYRFIHEEPTKLDEDPFWSHRSRATYPLDGNQALPTLTFWRDPQRFQERWPALTIRHKELFSLLLYPLSGGYGYPSLIPRFGVPAVRWIERRLSPLRRWLAFRTLVVLERC
ncbi:MAG: methyltransferase domain-containing protein [Nitrospinota bacterium]